MYDYYVRYEYVILVNNAWPRESGQNVLDFLFLDSVHGSHHTVVAVLALRRLQCFLL